MNIDTTGYDKLVLGVVHLDEIWLHQSKKWTISIIKYLSGHFSDVDRNISNLYTYKLLLNALLEQ